ncbi:MAG: DUF4102 domain-containing protein [Hyphomicrobiaceae bacterium]|nr:DUF4102 domain-containing protein [Hyphomicrobiaceae bacterium]
MPPSPRPAANTFFDDQPKGLARVSPSGEKSWIVEYRANGGGRAAPKRRITLGAAGQLTPEVSVAAADTPADRHPLT